jgi:ribosome maturation factor RimP
MTHPLVPQIIELATPLAEALGLELVGAVFQTSHHPPVLRVDIRNRTLGQDTSLDDCERMSHCLETTLDEIGVLQEEYVLEVSSPGVSRLLSTDREFISFKGFPVTVIASQPHAGHQEWTGQLIGRDEAMVYLSQKGRAIAIPRNVVAKVQLVERHA